MKMYLILCYYDEYCQGWEETYGYFLVYAENFEEACIKLKLKLNNAHNFINNTIE
jgi:hypothetical protein